MIFDTSRLKWQKGSHGLPECYYKINIPSVTGIINACVPDPELDAFIQNVGKEKAEQIMTSAGHRGSSMHMFIEQFVSTLDKTKDPSHALEVTQKQSPLLLESEKIPIDKIEEGLKLFYKFYYSPFSNQFTDIIGQEMGIYSPTLFYRGKLDIFYKHRIFEFSVSDFKSMSTPVKKGSAKEYKMKLQLGAYGNALDEMYQSKGLRIKHGSLICVNKKDDIVTEISCSGQELEKMKEEFKTLVITWHRQNNQEYLIKNQQ